MVSCTIADKYGQDARMLEFLNAWHFSNYTICYIYPRSKADAMASLT